MSQIVSHRLNMTCETPFCHDFVMKPCVQGTVQKVFSCARSKFVGVAKDSYARHAVKRSAQTGQAAVEFLGNWAPRVWQQHDLGVQHTSSIQQADLHSHHAAQAVAKTFAMS